MQRECALGIVKEQLKKLHITLEPETEDIHMNLLYSRQNYDTKYRDWIKQIIQQNQLYKIYNQKKLEEILWKKWAEIVYFEFRKRKGLSSLKVLKECSPKHYKYFLVIYKERSKRNID